MSASIKQRFAALQAQDAALKAGPGWDEMNRRAYRWWGKAGHGPADHHSALPVHLLAVAAAFDVLLRDPFIEQAMANAWGVERSVIRQMRPWLVWIAALHDLGKVLHEFQNKRPDVVAWIKSIRLGVAVQQPEKSIKFDHSVDGGLRLVSMLLENLGAGNDVNGQPYFGRALAQGLQHELCLGLFCAAFAHHGYHPGDQGVLVNSDSDLVWKDVGHDVMALAWSLADVVQACVDPFMPMVMAVNPGAVEHLFAGLVAIADWVGSDESLFPFIDCKKFAEQYSSGADWRDLYADFVGRAKRRIDSLGAFDVVPDAKLGIADAVILGGHQARTVQKKAQEAAQWLVDANKTYGSRGGLLIVEAPMGVGKTEAAFLAARIFMSARECAGLAFALPAQASANMLFKRLFPLAQGVFGLDQPSLAHGQASFAAQRIRQERSTFEGEMEGHESAAHLDEWITDDQKKAFLSTLCACTVDQMEMAAMHSKHGSVRYATLARQVVVIDEVHAYDAYMQTVLSSLLGMLGAAGTPVILLSATLPANIRKGLVDAYTGGRPVCSEHGDLMEKLSGVGYPVVHAAVNPKGLAHDPATLRTWSAPWTDPLKKVNVCWCADSDWLEMAAEMALSGLSVVVIANTVKSARKRHRLLTKRIAQRSSGSACFPAPILLHSRFRGEDRLSVQGRIEGLLGRSSSPEERRGVVIVATQVLEQSIDIDADVMFSEAAPIDLLLQRSGRLHRHERPCRSVEANFYVIVPDEVLRAAHDGAMDLSKAMVDPEMPKWWTSSLMVYAEGAKVPATMQELRSRSQSDGRTLAMTIEVPTDIPRLVDAVYGDEESVCTQKQLLAKRQGRLVTLDSAARPGALAIGAMRSSSTRLSDEDTGGIKLLCVVEDSNGDLKIPTANGYVRLPSQISSDGQRVNPAFLSEAQPWLLTIPRRSPEGVRLLAHAPSKQQLNFDWRFGETIDSADKTRHEPPFVMISVRQTEISSTRCSFELCPGVFYASDLGVFDAQGD